MKIKVDWFLYLHQLRKRELDIIFQEFPDEKHFETALELGAGDGFQSEILSKYTKHLIATDINLERLKKVSTQNIEYKICDAEMIDSYFPEKSFDFIFSSNLLEHLPQPIRALTGIHRILKDDGITVHIMPSPFWKLCHMVLFYPNLVISKFESILTKKSPMEFFLQKISLYFLGRIDPSNLTSMDQMGNNPKVVNRCPHSLIQKLVWPVPHGVARTNWEELLSWQKKRWSELFDRSGYQVLAILKGPAFSGYGFGMERVRRFLEEKGYTSEFIYIAAKTRCPNPFSTY